MRDLFDQANDERRARLKALGWTETGNVGPPTWKRPDGAVVAEAEAFAQLEAMDRKESACEQ